MIITGYTGPSESVFTTTLPTVTVTSPIIIKPGDEYPFTVTFTPRAQRYYPSDSSTFDIIIFSNNARRIDSTLQINGRGIQAGLISNSYDWERRRIDRAAFPIPAYPADLNNPVIVLINSGTEAVKITGITEIKNIRGDAFIFDRNKFNNLTVLPGTSDTIPVTFHPTAVGDYELTFRYLNSAGSETETQLKGAGIVSHITTTDYKFDTTIVNDTANRITKKIRFTNESWAWGDSLKITDFICTNPPAISQDGVNFGSEGFRYDKSGILLPGQPVILQQGQYIEFDAEFLAQKNGGAIGKLRSVSDAESDTTSTWTGYGYSQGIIAEGGSVTVCVNQIGLINCYVENNGDGNVVVKQLVLQQFDNTYFSFNNPADALGFTLKPGERRLVVIKYQPLTVTVPGVDHKADLVVVNSTIDNPQVIAVPDIQGTAVQYARSTSMVIPEELKIADIGLKIPCSIKLNPGDDITLARVQLLNVSISYAGSFLKVVKEDIVVGDLLKNSFTLEDLVVDDVAGKITFNLKAKGATDILNHREGGEIAKFTLETYLPTAKANVDSSTVTQIVTADGNVCVPITNTGSMLRLKPTCIYDLRWIATAGGTKYMFKEIVPNPVSSTGGNFEFTVALEGWTEISIYNSNGELISKPVSEQLSPGSYTVNIPVEILSSGLYHCRMLSGAYQMTRDLLITK